MYFVALEQESLKVHFCSFEKIDFEDLKYLLF